MARSTVRQSNRKVLLRVILVAVILGCVNFKRPAGPQVNEDLLSSGDSSEQQAQPTELSISSNEKLPLKRGIASCGEDSADEEVSKVDVADGLTCNVESNAEYSGDVVSWGAHNIQQTAEDCCRSCQAAASRGCNVWVWCGAANGCRGGDGAFGECWLKHQQRPAEKDAFRRGDDNIPWTSGAIFSQHEYDVALAAIAADKSERLARRNQKGNAHVFIDVSLNDGPACRIEFVLYMHIAPLAAENFRQMCTGEKNDGIHTFKGASFYRILDQFIDQSGVPSADSVFGGAFDDDPGGLQLRHDRKGLLSTANSGPNTNTGHFSILMAAAPHLDTKYVVFGEVVKGMSWAQQINRLATPTGKPSGAATIVDAGQLGWMLG